MVQIVKIYSSNFYLLSKGCTS